MNLQKVSDEEKLKLCRLYFLIGFAFLPYLWLVNGVWFFSEAFCRKPVYPQQGQIKKSMYCITLASGQARFSMKIVIAKERDDVF